ncbi:MAG TPA: hypothetical protein VIL86_04325 [Tepidisphaeraceae bacterium]|jgi:hypothetical protein
MIGKSISWVAFALMLVLLSAGCGKSESSNSGSSGGSGGGGAPSGSAHASGVERDAEAAMMAEIKKHWSKSADGWTSAFTTGFSNSPDHFLRQFKEIMVDRIDVDEVTETDKLNGIEWTGMIWFKDEPCREAGDQGIMLDGMSNLGASVNRNPGRWTQYVEYQPEPLRVSKVKGKWEVHQDTMLLHGKIPQPADYARAGMK